jgi:AcrR family transcriptional regulator
VAAAEQVERRSSRLSPERETELLTAVVDTLREVGYDALTMDAVAARARTSKATLYRQWQNKPNLVTTALKHLTPVFGTGVDTGSLAGDLHLVARTLADVAADGGELLASMGHAVMRDPELAAVFREVLIEPERDAFRAIVMRAVERGELASVPASLDYCGPLLVQAVVNRPVCEGTVCTLEFLTGLVDTVILPALRNS